MSFPMTALAVVLFTFKLVNAQLSYENIGAILLRIFDKKRTCQKSFLSLDLL